MKQTGVGESVTPKIASIRALAAEGYPLVPLKGKVPAVRSWTETRAGQYGEDVLARGNYGVVLQASDVVLDVDPRNFRKDDPKALSRLCAQFPSLGAALENTFVVGTGGGGLHAYFSKPADLKLRQALQDYPGIEIKTAGRQVVGPGSIHPETQKPYVILRNSPAAVQALPADVLAALAAPAEVEAPAEKGTDAYVDDSTTRARYEAYLLTAPTSGSYAVACQGRDFGLPPKTTWEIMVAVWNPRRATPRTPDELKTRVLHAYKYAKGAVGSKHPSAAGFEKLEAAEIPAAAAPEGDDIAWNMNGGRVTKSLFNLMNYLKWKQGGLFKVFGYNQFTGQVEFTAAAPWHKGRMPASPLVQDDDLKLLRAYLCDKHDFEASITDIEHGLTAVAHKNPFHPVREYLDGLKWDGKSRLDFWLHNFLGAPKDDYTMAVGRKFLCAAVTRVYKPGVKFDHVPVLEGPQGIGKSTVVKILGGQWAGDFTVDPHSKDTVQLMQGKWFIEIAELEFKGKAEEDAVKAFITRSTDKARLAYGRYATEFPRQSVFIASKNPASDGTFLKDETGGRRWWPVSCRGLATHGGKVDFKGLKDARDQLFAEAVERVRTVGEALFMDTMELTEAARTVVDLRRADHPWTESIGTWLDGRADHPVFLTGIEIFRDCLGGIAKEFDRRKALGVASAMRALGWAPDVQRVGEHKRLTRGYGKFVAEKKAAAHTKVPAGAFGSLY